LCPALCAQKEEAATVTTAWSNRETEEVFAEVLRDCDDLAEVVREWTEMLGQDSIESYAQRLKKDFESCYGFDETDNESSRLTMVACSMLFERVDWRQVAERLLARAQKV
jgi:hypothetical protein